MKTVMVLLLAGLAAAPLAGCDTPQQQNAANGALLGGATGAVLGGLLTGRPGGALVGAAAGATTGAIVGSASTPPGPYYGPGPGPAPGPGPGYRCAEWYYDYYGNRVCRSWY
ncbi:MAG: glycine zipper 2TM domain-containing protein [Bradyrhizobium sp.]|nr:MAG: glycine zipper 2TM domain-containing protein [Bradyrhizobium sp.]